MTKCDDLFPEMIQTVTLKSSDGKKATFAGSAVLFKGTKKIVEASFGDPKEMPAGCSWGEVK